MTVSINTLFKLIQSGYVFKKNIKKYLKYDSSSPEYQLAQFYNDTIKKLEKEDNELKTFSLINSLREHIQEQKSNLPISEDGQKLNLHAISFLDSLQSIGAHKK